MHKYITTILFTQRSDTGGHIGGQGSREDMHESLRDAVHKEDTANSPPCQASWKHVHSIFVWWTGLSFSPVSLLGSWMTRKTLLLVL